MKRSKIESALFMVSFAILVVALSAMSCGGGSGGSGSAVAQATSAGGNFHLSTLSGVLNLPASSSFAPRTISFTPDVDEVIIKIYCEGTYTRTTATGGSSSLQMVVTHQGEFDKYSYAWSISSGPVTARAFRMEVVDLEWATSAAYTIALNAVTDAAWGGYLEDVRFRILTMKVAKLDPSSKISG